MSGDPPDGTDLGPILVPVQHSGSPAGRRVRLAVAGWLLGLAGVAALGLSGHVLPPQAAIAPEAGVTLSTSPPSPATPAATIESSARPRAVRRPITYYRALGKDGLVGGIVFGNNVRQPEERD